MKMTLKLSAVTFAVAFAAPAFAQNAPDRIVLESKAGSVMSTTGGAYETAPTGKQLVVGESMMLNDGATANVVYYYDNGDRKCVETYTGPNTYVIDDRCIKPGSSGNGSPGKSALIIVGAGLIGAAILESMDDVPVGPLSTGPNGNIRHF